MNDEVKTLLVVVRNGARWRNVWLEGLVRGIQVFWSEVVRGWRLDTDYVMLQWPLNESGRRGLIGILMDCNWLANGRACNEVLKATIRGGGCQTVNVCEDVVFLPEFSQRFIFHPVLFVGRIMQILLDGFPQTLMKAWARGPSKFGASKAELGSLFLFLWRGRRQSWWFLQGDRTEAELETSEE